MKYAVSMILIILLIFPLAGCSQQDRTQEEETIFSEIEQSDETLPLLTEVPSQETSAPAKIYPQTLATAILIEGEPEKLIMDLFDGGNYVIYIPQDTWTLTTELKNGFLTDRWSCSWAPEVFLEIVSCGSLSKEDAAARFREIFSGETLEELEPGVFSILDPSWKRYRSLSIYSDGANTFAILTEMPAEFGDGFSPRFNAMVNTFEIK